MSSTMILVLMALVFLGLGYMGVPVAFALIGGVLVATALTPISFQSIIGQLFHGIDSGNAASDSFLPACRRTDDLV